MGQVEVRRSGVTLNLVLEKDLSVERRAGRPNAEIDELPTQDLPRYKDKPRPASDVFELAGTITSDRTFDGTTRTPEEQARIAEKDILRPPLGDNTLTLEFVNLFGLGTFSVVPQGGQAGRVSWSVGETGVTRVDNLSLRVSQ